MASTTNPTVYDGPIQDVQQGPQQQVAPASTTLLPRVAPTSAPIAPSATTVSSTPAYTPPANLNPEGQPYNEPTPENDATQTQDPYQSAIKSALAASDAVNNAFNNELTSQQRYGQAAGESGDYNSDLEAAESQRQTVLGQINDNISKLQANDATAQATATAQLAALAKNNIDWEDYKTSNPQNYQNLVTALGGNANYADAVFAASIPPANIKSQNINGSTVTTAFLNPTTGQITATTQQIVNPETGQPIVIPPQWTFQNTASGGYIMQDPNNPSNFVIGTPSTYTNQFTGLSTKSIIISGAGGAGVNVAKQAGWSGGGNTAGSTGQSGGATTAPANGTTATNGGASSTTPTNSASSQYGLIANVPGFNPNPNTQEGIQDLAAAQYLQNYFRGGAAPSSGGMGGIAKTVFNAEVANRAAALFKQATGQDLPPQSVISTNLGNVSTNETLLNTLANQVGTVNANFLLSLQNQDTNAVNQAAPIINGVADTLSKLAGSTSVAQYLAQNETIQNELGTLLSVKNASGTTVADKIAAGDLLPSDLSAAQQAQILTTLMQEANNQKTSIINQNAQTYLQNDPAALLPGNPVNNTLTITDSSGNSYQVNPGQLTPAQLNDALSSGYTITSNSYNQ